jgi:hypothetical protein
VKEYNSWEQVAGYFDGDGNFSITDMTGQPFKLRISLFFTDASHEQISMLRSFFSSRGIITSNVLRTSKCNAWIIAISRFNDVLLVTKAILPHLFKKANEAQAVIDYYEGRIRGNDLVEIFAKEVEAGRRERRSHRVKIDVPYTFPEGNALMKAKWKERKREVMFRIRAKVTQEDFEHIRRQHFDSGKSVRELLQVYPQYSRETMRRILGKGRGYVLVKGKGLVKTTDSR